MKPTERMPEELARQLAAFERRLRFIETLVAVFAALTGALGALALLALLDRFVDTPRALRLALAAAGGLTVSLSAVWWVRHWLWKRRDVRDLARLVQRRYPRLGDRLLGAVELSAEDAEITGASPALVRAALRQVAEESRAFNFREAAPTRAARRYGWALTLLFALLGIGLALAPEALLRSARRWIRPAAEVERYTFTRIADLPETLIVAHGEPFEIECGLDPRSRWRPAEGVARIGDQPPVRAAIRDNRARFSFPGQTSNAELTLRIGDDRRRVALRPTLRPELIAMEARIEWPAYLRREPETRRVERGRIALLPDARAAFAGRAVRELSSAALLGEGVEPLPLPVEESVFTTPARAALEWSEAFPGAEESTALLQMVWTDRAGLAGARPYRLEVMLTADAAPTLEVEGIRGAVAILPDEALNLTVRAQDDYGMAAVGWQWRVDEADSDPEKTPPLREGRAVAAQDDTGVNRRLDGAWRLSPLTIESGAGRVVTLWAWATDHRPDRGPTVVGPYRVYVLSPEEHARLVREMMERISARMEDLLRGEERQLAETEALRSLDDEALAHERTTSAMNRSETAERANESMARELAEEIEKMLKEGLRNDRISTEELRPWTAAEMALREEAARAMAEAAQALAQAAQSSSAEAQSEQQRQQQREQLAEASEAQKRAVEALRQAAKEAEQNMESSLARSFVNRLKEIAGLERENSGEWTRLLPEVVGLNANEFNARQRERMADARGRHERARRETQNIRNDLGAFFARTRKPVYNQVRELMLEPDVLLHFGEISKLAEKAMLSRGIEESEALAAKFEEWAKLLEPPQNESAGRGQGEGGGEGEKLEPEVLLGMMRARVIEEMLREQTRAADEAPERDTTERLARHIGERQAGLTKDFRDLSEKTRHEKAAQFLRALAEISDEAHERVIRPDTGGETIAVQTEIIEAIAQATSSSSDSSSSSSSSESQSALQQMAMALARMRQMQLGKGEGQEGGGSASGGDSAGVGRHGGPGSGDLAAGSTARGARPDVATWPAEFRDAIQAYYESIEGQP